jgi:arylsulfatase
MQHQLVLRAASDFLGWRKPPQLEHLRRVECQTNLMARERDISRRAFCRMTAAGSAALTLASRLHAQPAKLPRKPNLLVFLPDQQRADTLACYGGVHIHAPNLNKLAARSFVFQQAYIAQPICTPSRSSLMTGTWPHTNGCTRNNTRLDARFRCLPEMIDDPDYRCAYMGKWHLGDEPFAQHGFTEWVSIMDRYQKHFSPGRDQRTISDYGKFLISKGLTQDKKKKTGFSIGFPTSLPIELSRPRFLQAKACDFLERHRGDPFVLFVAFLEPHPPYNGPLNNEHPIEEINLDRTATEIMGPEMPLRYRALQQTERKSFTATPENIRKTKQKYLGLVTEVDQSIGAILSKLEQLGIADNTIVVHTTDHGDMLGAHRLFGKKVMFQEAARVPYLVRLPSQSRMVSIPQPVSHIDFLPTMLDLLGKPPHEQCAGTSRAPLLRGESLPAENVFLEWAPEGPHPHTLEKPEEVQRAITESTRAVVAPDSWKLCLRDHDRNELYNLSRDPDEQHNLFYTGEHREVIDRLTNNIHIWQQRVGDTLKV